MVGTSPLSRPKHGALARGLVAILVVVAGLTISGCALQIGTNLSVGPGMPSAHGPREATVSVRDAAVSGAGPGPVPKALPSCDAAPQSEASVCDASIDVLAASSASAAPPGRWGASMVWDAADGYMLMFGGSHNPASSWQFLHGIWTELNPTQSPGERDYPSMAYDPAIGKVVLFGGHTLQLDHNDTWEFAGGQWANVTTGASPNPAASPHGRAFAALTYDPGFEGGSLILFGGGYYPTYELNDTWAFLPDGTWSNITATASPTPANTPAERQYPNAVYDSGDGYLLMYGGQGTAGHGALGDTWEFSGGVWTNVSSQVAQPTLSAGGAFAYDSGDGYAVLFSGISQLEVAKGSGRGETTDNYTWTYAGGTWTNITASVHPPARFGTAAAYDPSDGYLVMLGGLAGTQEHAAVLKDTWIFASGAWSNITKSYLVKFAESKLPHGTKWSVTIDNQTTANSGSLISFSLPNGSYPFTITAVGYSATPSLSSPFTVSGVTVTVSVVFDKTPAPQLTSLVELQAPTGARLRGGPVERH
jgi:hypothetical protein